MIINPELKELLTLVRDKYSGIYADWADKVLQLPELTDLKEKSKIYLDCWQELKCVSESQGLVYLSEQEASQLNELMTKHEQQNVLLRPHHILVQNVEQLNQELTTERESTQQALQTSQEWHERQKAEIIAQWKTKLQTFINQRKTQLRQEIELIKEVLHE